MFVRSKIEEEDNKKTEFHFMYEGFQAYRYLILVSSRGKEKAELGED